MGASASVMDALEDASIAPFDASDIRSPRDAALEIGSLRSLLRKALVEQTGAMTPAQIKQYGEGLIEAGEFGLGENLLRAAISKSPYDLRVFHRYVAMLDKYIIVEGEGTAPCNLLADVQQLWATQAAAKQPTPHAMVIYGHLLRNARPPLTVEAHTCFTAAAKVSFPPAIFELGTLALSKGDLHGARRLLRSALEGDPASVETMNQLGLICHEVGDDAQAIAYFTGAIETDPALSYIHNNLGALLEKDESKTEMAEQHYRRVLELEPRDVMSRYNLARLLMARRAALCKLYDDGAAGFTMVPVDEQATVKALDDESLALLRVAVQLDPRDARTHNSLGYVLHNAARDFPAAEEAYRAAVALEPTQLTYLFNLAHLLGHELARYTEAAAIYNSLVTVCTLNDDARTMTHAKELLVDALQQASMITASVTESRERTERSTTLASVKLADERGGAGAINHMGSADGSISDALSHHASERQRVADSSPLASPTSSPRDFPQRRTGADVAAGDGRTAYGLPSRLQKGRIQAKSMRIRSRARRMSMFTFLDTAVEGPAKADAR